MLEGRYRNHIKGGFLFGHGTYHRQVLGNNTRSSMFMRFTTPTLLGLNNRGKSISLPILVLVFHVSPLRAFDWLLDVDMISKI